MIKPASRFSFLLTPRAAAATMIALAVVACGSAPVENTGPGPRNTGTYPNLNIPPEKAAPQLTTRQHAAAVSELTQKRLASQRPQAETPRDESGQLTDLGRTHGKRALSEIEKGE